MARPPRLNPDGTRRPRCKRDPPDQDQRQPCTLGELRPSRCECSPPTDKDQRKPWTRSDHIAVAALAVDLASLAVVLIGLLLQVNSM